jgi:TolA-binding protein
LVPKERSRDGVESLRRELIEARNLAIKTDNLVKNLSAEIKQIARHQDAYQRKYLFNSGIAYILFVAVVFTGLYIAFNAKITSAHRDVEHYTARNAQLREQLENAERDLERRREAETIAYEFFELLENGSRDDVVERFTEVQAQLADRAMIELFRDRVEEINYELSEEAYREGMTYIQQENWSDARDAFLKSLDHLDRTPWAPELYFFLGEALYNLDDYEGALHYTEQALAAEELDDAHRAQAQYRRGLCLEATGRLVDATEAFRDFRSNYSGHRYYGSALRHINAIEREINRQNDD